MEEVEAQFPSDLANVFQKLAKKPAEERQLRLTLALLQPLANEEMLATCRAKTSRFVANPYNAQAGPFEDEVYLDLDPLSDAWRKEWKEMPDMSSLHVEFDNSLPRGDDGKIVEDMRWQAGGDSSMYVFWVEYQSLVTQMATYARMRTAGTVTLAVSDKREGLQSTYPDELGKQLENLAKDSKPLRQWLDSGNKRGFGMLD